jgi:hypothetical protein
MNNTTTNNQGNHMNHKNHSSDNIPQLRFPINCLNHDLPD